MAEHEHVATWTQQGVSTLTMTAPLYEFCACGSAVRLVWPSGRTIDWHRPSAEKAAEARKLATEEFESNPL